MRPNDPTASAWVVSYVALIAGSAVKQQRNEKRQERWYEKQKMQDAVGNSAPFHASILSRPVLRRTGAGGELRPRATGVLVWRDHQSMMIIMGATRRNRLIH